MSPLLMQVVGDGRPSGGTTVVLALARDLAELGRWRVALVTQRDSYALEAARAMGLEVHGVEFFRSRFDPTTVRQLGALVRSEQPRLVHAHAARAGFPLSLALPRSGRPKVVYTVHSYHFLHQPAALRGLGALAERRCHTMADATTFVCQLDGRIARRWRLLPRGARTHQIPNGIDPTEFPEPVVGDGPTVVFLGNLIHQKHPELFVELAARLAHEAPSSRFVMIGGGDLEGRVRQLIGAYHLTPRFTLTGRIPRDQALLHLAAASVLVMPSRWEGAPVVLLEAMQLGVPVVCSDFEAMKEFVRDGVTGLLVGQRDPAAYATAVRRVLDDEALRARLVSAARQQVQDHYLRSTITARYRELYQQLLETGGLA